MLKVWLNGKVVGLTDISKTRRNSGSLCTAKKMMSYGPLIFSVVVQLQYYSP